MYLTIRLPFALVAFAIHLAAFTFISKEVAGSKVSIFYNEDKENLQSINNNTSDISAKYNDWQLEQKGVGLEMFSYAMTGFEKLKTHCKLIRENVLTIIDFSKPSTEKRLFVIDLSNGRLLFSSLVAHGRNSGQLTASSFSNRTHSFESSPGFYITQQIYLGKHGRSLKLLGCETGINNNALARGIVLHGADYVSERFIEKNGYLGRSQGCPAVPVEMSEDIIESIKGGSCFFIYTSSKKYLSASALLKS